MFLQKDFKVFFVGFFLTDQTVIVREANVECTISQLEQGFVWLGWLTERTFFLQPRQKGGGEDISTLGTGRAKEPR